MTDQLEMFAAPTPPENDDARVLLHFLRGRGWMNADAACRGIAQWTRDEGWLVTRRGVTVANERRIRAAAEASDGQVLSGPGSPGYRTAVDCPVVEFEAKVYGPTKHQVDRMTARLVAMSKIVNGANAKQTGDEH